MAIVSLRLCLSTASLPLLLALMGCSSGSGGGSPAAATCDDWKEAHCAYLDECLSSTSNCLADLADESCATDAPLDRCVAELNRGCDTAPSNCEVYDIVDTSQAISRCAVLENRYCESYSRCDSSVEVSQCVATVEGQLLCDYAVYTSADYDICIEALMDESCETTLPSSCTGVIFK